MTFRTRLLIGFTVAAALPLGVLAFGIRGEVVARLTVQFDERRRARVQMVTDDLARESVRIAERLRGIAASLPDDDRFRQAAVRGDVSARQYLLDFGSRAMAATGLTMFQMQDTAGRILTSGHFRQEFDRLDAELAVLLRANAGSATLVRARSPEGSFLSLVRADTVTLAGRRFVLIGGTTVDATTLGALVRDDVVRAALVMGDSTVLAAGEAQGNVATDTVPLTFADVARGGSRLAPAHIVLWHSQAGVDAVRADVNRWLTVALVFAGLGALALATWLAARVSRPLTELAQATSHIQLAGGDITMAADRYDEIGVLATRLRALTSRLRSSAAQLRDAERRATIGELARQVNHDIKNGLSPIRNVLRHLSGVAEQDPSALAQAFGERRATLDSSVDYLDRLARNYAKLTPRLDRVALDVNAVVAEAVRSASATEKAAVRAELASALPRVAGDALALRRIVDNLVTNAIESVDGRGGAVRVSTKGSGDGVVIVVADNGRGMSADDLSHAFEDFFTTKADGTGLGLSVVRRLVSDMGGDVRAESEPERGTTVTVTLPAEP